MNVTEDRGLTTRQVGESRARFGENVLTPVRRKPAWKKLLEKFRDPLIVILLVACILSLGISFYEYFALGEPWNAFAEPVGIVAAILLSTFLSFAFEQKANKEFSILNKVNDDEPVVVLRDGRWQEIHRREVVVGDVVSIQTGAEVPADGRLMEATALRMDESTLTGEPSCMKSADPSEATSEDTYPPTQVYRGTRVLDGRGIYEVTAVGDATEYGHVYKEAQIDKGVRTPLDEQLEKLGAMISRLSYVIAFLIIVGRTMEYFLSLDGPVVWSHAIAYILQSLMIAVTVIVVAVPEGLPMAVTLSLAYSMRRMLKTNNLVRKMHACETMGAATVICTDKTGTLTQNRMRVAEMHVPDDIPESLLEEAISVNSTAMVERDGNGIHVIGNPTEGALLVWLMDREMDYRRDRDAALRLDEISFTTERKYMATVVMSPITGGRALYVKGASEILFPLCEWNGGRGEVEAALQDCQRRAMRTISFAYKELSDGEQPFNDGNLCVGGLHYMGFAAISDPVREDVPDAVRDCLDAGLDIKIITGDTMLTAREIGRQIGIWQDGDDGSCTMTGAEVAAMTDDELMDRISGVKIISRARPKDKERIVAALQRLGEVVAVTGDGTNDAPALNTAHVGLSMGDGTSVAKEASDITIIDNSFASIGRAVLWGRSLYQNIQRFILFQMTVNVSACLIVLAGAFMGVQSPLTVTQMLWINLIMDTFAAMALASLPPEGRLMHKKPRNRKAFIIDKGMAANIMVVGGLMCIVMVAINWVFEHSNVSAGMSLADLEIGKYDGLSSYELCLFFTTYVFMQIWNLFNAKAYGSNDTSLRLRGCWSFVFILLVIFIGQVVIVYAGGDFFGVTPLAVRDFVRIALATSVIFIAGELCRLFRRCASR